MAPYPYATIEGGPYVDPVYAPPGIAAAEHLETQYRRMRQQLHQAVRHHVPLRFRLRQGTVDRLMPLLGWVAYTATSGFPPATPSWIMSDHYRIPHFTYSPRPTKYWRSIS